MYIYNEFANRHIGPRPKDIEDMLKDMGLNNLDELIDKTIPDNIKLSGNLNISNGISESEYLNLVKKISEKNRIFKTYIGMGYYNTITPSVIKRNILENPNWYTSYTPYQAEISQGRLEALLNFQTLITSLTGLEIANASLLDESTAAAEAMIMSFNARSREAVKNEVNKFFVDREVFPQTISVIKTRAKHLNINVIIDSFETIDIDESYFGCLVQYPNNMGNIQDYSMFSEKVHGHNIILTVAADIMSLLLLKSPGSWGADIVVGSAQRFGLPMGYGGPHAGYFATKEDYKRLVPGRIIGISVDAKNKPAYRMALQTREQHIKREKATSNICTAQALLAIMSGMYAVYHGKEGLSNIAADIHNKTRIVEEKLSVAGFKNLNDNYFDTLFIQLKNIEEQSKIKENALKNEINLRYFANGNIGISIDETISHEDIDCLISVFSDKKELLNLKPDKINIAESFLRNDNFLCQKIFNSYHSETEMMRYIKRLEKKDISLTDSMISLGSCTMKLNAATTLIPLSWPEFGNIHPFVPTDQAGGYRQIINELEEDLKTITGFDRVSFQPNSGASGEYAGLTIIRSFHENNGQNQRDTVLIPASAHGTNPASAAMAGLNIVVVKCDVNGNIDINDLKQKANEYKERLSCLMVTYPSTHGVFEESICEITSIIHKYGGQVYMDGANMNAQVGLTNPASIGADVCHLNLHKTFAIPHGGGGPGVGPVCVAKHLSAFLPSHPLIKNEYSKTDSVIAAAPWGSALILLISHAYCRMLGEEGLSMVTKMAILNSNYMASKLEKYFKILYKGIHGTVAHEMIVDCREFKNTAGVSEIDIAKRLIDFGYHAPTVSFPVHGTLMIEPTESESKEELDRFIETMITIYEEIKDITIGDADKINNVLKNAPHSSFTLTDDKWEHPYTREKAGFPLSWVKENKYWPPVDRLNDAYGDRNLICSCN